MERKLLVRLACALLVSLAASHAGAQETAPPAPQTRLVVQVEYFQGAPLSFESVPGSSWYARFGVNDDGKARAAADRILAVAVKTRLDGGRVEIKVGVHVGERHFDRLDEVATYTAAAGETVEARDLARFGVVPFVFKVLSVSDRAAAPPRVVNNTQSIEAAVTEFTTSPLPRARLALRNLSSKRVRAIALRQVLNGRPRGEGFLRESEARMLIEPGGTCERRIGMTSGQSSPAEFAPDAVESVIIDSAVFDDYTYEGDVVPAARKRAFDDGERAQLPRLLALVREAQAARDVAPPEVVRRFRSQLAALDYSAPAPAVEAIMQFYPQLAPTGRVMVKSAFEVSMHQMRRLLLDDLGEFEKKFQAAPAEHSFKRWLRAKQGKFEEWLSRL